MGKHDRIRANSVPIRLESTWLMDIENPFMHVYFHIPFCKARCSYCDFNTYAGLESMIPAYVQALCTDIENTAVWCSKTDPALLQIDTIFFGGGTPSILPIKAFRQLSTTLSSMFSLSQDLEWTIEANPGTLRRGELECLRRQGVNRLSLGVQSSHAEELELLGRIHRFSDSIEVFHAARQAGFTNLNLDLIFGLPQQTLAAWQTSLQRCLELEPDHLSLYALSLEPGTRLWKHVHAGEIALPDEDLTAEMYALARETLAQCGYAHYEISNWARCLPEEPSLTVSPQLACQHNLNTWHNQHYLGLGAGAHGYIPRLRYANLPHPEDYIHCLQTPGRVERALPSNAIQDTWPISRELEMAESVILGLRLTREGVYKPAFRDRFAVDLESEYSEVIEEYQQLGLLEVTAERMRLSTRGQLLANQVMQAFLPA